MEWWKLLKIIDYRWLFTNDEIEFETCKGRTLGETKACMEYIMMSLG